MEGVIGGSWALLLDTGRAEQAYRRMIELRPELPDAWMGLCQLRLRQRDFEGARQLLREKRAYFAGSSDPDCDPVQLEALIELFARNYSAAEQLYQKIAEDPQAHSATPLAFAAVSHESALARLLQLRGEEKAAREMLERSGDALNAGTADGRAVPLMARHYRAAALESCLGKTDAAIDNLRKAVAAGWLDVRALELDPRFDELRGDLRFAEVIESLHAKIAELRTQVALP
jgi:tetratricopeptide (TPR) repeat protein